MNRNEELRIEVEAALLGQVRAVAEGVLNANSSGAARDLGETVRSLAQAAQAVRNDA